MKAKQLVKGKKTCPFLMNNFQVDITKSQISRDFIKKFGTACPYLQAKKIEKQTIKAKEALQFAYNQNVSSLNQSISKFKKQHCDPENCQNQPCQNVCQKLKFEFENSSNNNINNNINENINNEEKLHDALENFHKAFQIDANFEGKKLSTIADGSQPLKCPYAQILMNQQENEVDSREMENVQKQQKQDIYASKFSDAIQNLKTENRYRVFNHIQRIVGKYPKATMEDRDGLVKEITVWCSNDYLGMGQIKEVQDAMIQSIRTQGIGAGGTRNIGGSSTQHLLLERDLANFHSKEASVVCSSGFVANQSALNALKKVMPDIVYLSDEKNHASIIEGISNSRAQKKIWKHNDLQDLEEKLASLPFETPKCVIFESVYSMSGTIAPINEICDLAKKYNAMTFIDEVHAIGLYGARGAGVAQQMGIEHKLDFISGTLAKGIGCFGGYVVGKKEAIDCIRSYAPNFIFTTSIPPSVAAACRKSIQLIQEQQELRDKLHDCAHKLKQKFFNLGIRMEPSQSHIVPIFIGSAEKAKQISDLLLLKHGHYIQPINFPTVPRGEELLRISPTPNHTEEMIEELAASILQVFQEVGQPLADFQNRESVFVQRGAKFQAAEQLLRPFDSSAKEAIFSQFQGKSYESEGVQEVQEIENVQEILVEKSLA